LSSSAFCGSTGTTPGAERAEDPALAFAFPFAFALPCGLASPQGHGRMDGVESMRDIRLYPYAYNCKLYTDIQIYVHMYQFGVIHIKKNQRDIVTLEVFT
jgi:hypothetical protein